MYECHNKINKGIQNDFTQNTKISHSNINVNKQRDIKVKCTLVLFYR